ncbi:MULTISPECIES: LysR family transcriptional regulator [Brevibacillus]|jgi:DNA-binding transcriptional LysR family regulator|uniref:Transcriptional regulator n=1 Tax=Brevibacillus borstelensis AK1 TaxID=1300222 RepID=M8E1P2_9BACL|nr:LysR family transcriptional regulator [Brevibacillus borstelensis]EMT53181.1 transcriptional regulator [Brevibacillus borstelensis AK1]KKX55433.1 transcriptional regulator [Brevibacillus borstelensis cifa_chp40]MBE5397606.1 LysR family transcriptional regulator [Brevibacillus borstelensis]MCC0563604.1 LysR family transcriptional regulator [Brevibacillus borstelensis]MCM3469247.1 LysR family transcriptional regulator [Brevibacillus borstelensis]
MDIRQLRYFIAIAEEGQITGAARRLRMAQPPLSQQLKQMEEELGVELIERSGKKIALTQAGVTLYKQALNLVHQMEEAISEVKETGEGVRGTLSVGVSALSSYRLPEQIRQFRERYPLITYKVWKGDTQLLSQWLEQRTVEVAIVRLPHSLAHCTTIPLLEETFVLIVPVSSPLSQKDSIHMREIADHPLIMPSTPGLGIYELLVKEFGRLGVTPHVICECPDLSLIVSMVGAGVAAAIVPRSAWETQGNANISRLEITGTSITSSSAIVWQTERHLSKAARHFIEMFAPIPEQ